MLMMSLERIHTVIIIITSDYNCVMITVITTKQLVSCDTMYFFLRLSWQLFPNLPPTVLASLLSPALIPFVQLYLKTHLLYLYYKVHQGLCCPSE